MRFSSSNRTNVQISSHAPGVAWTKGYNWDWGAHEQSIEPAYDDRFGAPAAATYALKLADIPAPPTSTAAERPDVLEANGGDLKHARAPTHGLAEGLGRTATKAHEPTPSYLAGT